MGYWRTGIAMLWGTVVTFLAVYATRVLPVVMGWQAYEWSGLDAGLLLVAMTLGALGLATLALVLLALAFWRRAEIRTSGRARILVGATTGTVILAVYAHHLTQG